VSAESLRDVSGWLTDALGEGRGDAG
jgi:hypothetical protein